MSRKMKIRIKKAKYLHSQCVKYIKHCQGGFIHPRDTSYESLSRAMAHYAGVESVANSSAKAECNRLAQLLGLVFDDEQRDGSRWAGEKSSKRKLAVNDPSTFYQSFAWKKLRYATLIRYGAKCASCGRAPPEVAIRVDHIKPISRYWRLRLDPDNVQPLCNDCNWGKLNLDETDWRDRCRSIPRKISLRVIK